MIQARRRALQESTSRYVQEKAVYEKIKKRRRRGLIRRLVAYTILAFALSATFISVYLSQNNLLQEKVEEHEALEQELANAKSMKSDLKEEVNKLQDPEYISEIARKEFFLSKEGEIIFKLPSDSSTN